MINVSVGGVFLMLDVYSVVSSRARRVSASAGRCSDVGGEACRRERSENVFTWHISFRGEGIYYITKSPSPCSEAQSSFEKWPLLWTRGGCVLFRQERCSGGNDWVFCRCMHPIVPGGTPAVPRRNRGRLIPGNPSTLQILGKGIGATTRFTACDKTQDSTLR